MESNKRLYFKRDCEQAKGFNVTVRKGDKHMVHEAGDAIELWASDQTKIGDAVVSFVAEFADVDQIPQFLMDMNHSSKARTQAGLEAAMQDAYGEGWRDDTFTVVVYVY